MVVYSRLLKPFSATLQFSNILKTSQTLKLNQHALQTFRQMSDHRTFVIQPSRFQWHKFKDTMHFFVMLGVIPITAIILYVNIFIGPSTLEPTPKGYVPKHWEYHRHPISRFLARYVYPSPQQEYEKLLHVINEEAEKAMLRRIEQEVHEKISERHDYQSYYYRPAIAKYHRISREQAEYLETIRGD